MTAVRLQVDTIALRTADARAAEPAAATLRLALRLLAERLALTPPAQRAAIAAGTLRTLEITIAAPDALAGPQGAARLADMLYAEIAEGGRR